MPLYEYQCDACAHRFEVIQKFSDPRIEVCPTCGSKVTKLFSSPAIQFKGSGWYITDYAKKSGTQSGGSGESTGGTSQGEAKSDARSDAKGSGDTKSTTESSASAAPTAPAPKPS